MLISSSYFNPMKKTPYLTFPTTIYYLIFSVCFSIGFCHLSSGEPATDDEIDAFMESMGVAPIVVPENPRLERDHDKAGREWEERVLGTEFRKRMKGHQFEAEALGLMERFLDRIYGPPYMAEQFEDELERGNVLIEKGFKDPYFLGRYAKLFKSLRDNDRYKGKLITQALKEFPNTEYSRALEFRLNFWLFESQRAGRYTSKGYPEEELAEKAADAFLSVLGDGTYRDDEYGIAVSHFRNYFKNGMKREYLALQERMASNESWPSWARNTLQGMIEVSKAWKERGSGWAHEVTPKGWEGFGKHLQQARVHFEKSWNENPEDPIAAYSMIKVVMGQGSQPGESMRLWFDRAISARFDFDPAYDALIYAYRPKWGGSHDLMRAFGYACWKTRRFDSKVPLYLDNVIRSIALERGKDWRTAYQDPETQTAMVDLGKNIAMSPTFQKQHPLHLSILAIFQCFCEDYKGGMQTLKQIGPRFQWQTKFALDDFFVSENQVRGEIEMGSLGLLNELKMAEQQFAEKKYDEAENGFLKLLKKSQGTAVPWLGSRLALIKFEKQLETGQWTPLEFEPDLALWESRRGKWKIDDKGRLTTKGEWKNVSNFRILHDGRVGDNFEMRANFRVEKKTKFLMRLGFSIGSHYRDNKSSRAQWTGVIWYSLANGGNRGGFLDRTYAGNFKSKVVTLPDNVSANLRLRSENGKLSFWIDDETVAENIVFGSFHKPSRPLPIYDDDKVGFVADFDGSEATVSIESAEIRRLTH